MPHSAPSGSHGEGAPVPADAISDGGSASDISLRMTPREDIPRTVGSPATEGRRRDTMTSLMSNMMRGMRQLSTPAPTTSAQAADSKTPEQQTEGKQEVVAAAAAADPSRRPRQSLAAFEDLQRAPSHGGARSGEEDAFRRQPPNQPPVARDCRSLCQPRGSPCRGTIARTSSRRTRVL